MMNILRNAAVALVATSVMAAPAWAGVPAAPGPLIGAGLPALAGLALVYGYIRRQRNR